MSSANAFRLLYAAQKYQVEALETKCVEFLQRSLNVDTVGSILDQAVFYNYSQLKDKCLDLLAETPAKSLERLNDTHMSKETLELIVGVEKLSLNGPGLFETCNNWARVECKTQGISANAENKRQVLGSVLKKMRFSSMTYKDIVSKVSPSGLLTLEEEVDLFRTREGPTPSPSSPRTSPKKEKSSELCVMFPSNFSTSKRKREGSFLAVLESDKVVTLLGFVFATTGTYRIRLEAAGCARSEHVKFNVYEEGAKLYLPNPYSFWEGKLNIEEDTYRAYGPLLGIRYCVHVFKHCSVCHKRAPYKTWPCGIWSDAGSGYTKPEATLKVTRTEGVPIGGIILSVL